MFSFISDVIAGSSISFDQTITQPLPEEVNSYDEGISDEEADEGFDEIIAVSGRPYTKI